jgi:hypothetical protein
MDVAVIGICAALYALVGRLTDIGPTFFGVAFYPAVIIPAIFAVLYGPWVGGIGAAIGIFVRDMLYHGNPLLSLTAGVTSNFVLFFIIGYMSIRKLNNKKILLSATLTGIALAAGLFLPTLLLPAEFAAYTGLPTTLIIIFSVVAVLVSLGIIGAVSLRWKEWKSFTAGAVIGQSLGAAIIAVGVWGYSQLFFSPTGYIKAPIDASLVPIIFVWTFATEIPFILLVAPPIIKVCYLAFPFLRQHQQNQEKAK